MGPRSVTPRGFRLDDERVQRVIDLTLAGRHSAAKMAAIVGVSARTCERWLARPDFKAALAEKRADFKASLEHVTFADKARRIYSLNDAALIALADLEDRPKLKEVRPTKDGEITNESFNAGAMAEFRAALADIAAELGERKNVTELAAHVSMSHDFPDDPEAAGLARSLIRRLTTGGDAKPGGAGVSGE